MKKYIGLALIFGWFFSFQAAYDDNGAIAVTLIGPFKSQALCKAEYDDLKANAKTLGLEIELKPCSFHQET